MAVRAILLLAFRGSHYVPISSSPSWPVLGFAFVLSLVTGIVFGVGPAWITSHSHPAEALRGAGQSTRDRSSLPQIGTRLLRGRLIGDQDMPTSRRVAVINQTFARKFFPKEDPSFGEQLTRNFNQDRLIARLTDLFGVLALMLACVGLYGVTVLQSAPAFSCVLPGTSKESGIIASVMKIASYLSATLPGLFVTCISFSTVWAQSPPPASRHAVVLRAVRLLDVETGKIIAPGEVLVQGERITEVGPAVKRPAGAEVIDLGDRTLLPGLIDAHVHLFLHPGAEDLQTIQESVPQRTISAALAARDDLMAGFTAERDMGTEGAGSADTAVRNAIDRGSIPGPRLRISGNAVDILGGHEDAIGYNPEQHIFSNATYANNAAELVTVIRQQLKEGADFIKVYETGPDSLREGHFSTPYQYTEAELSAAVREAARSGKRVAVHATGEPGTLYAARAGVVSIDHAFQLSDETMRMMREKQVFAVPTFTILEYFADHAASPAQAEWGQQMLKFHREEFRKQLEAGVPMAVGSDVGPFPHGTQAREFVLMVNYGMSPLAALQAGLLNGAKLLGWQDQVGVLKPGYWADVIAVPGDPLNDISVLQRVGFVMKGGVIYRR